MASTTAGAELTERHRRRQLTLRSMTLREFLAIFPALNLSQIDQSWPAVEAALLALIGLRKRDSASLAAAYYSDFRDAESGAGGFSPRTVDDLDIDAAIASLRVTGPIGAKIAARNGARSIRDITLTRLSGSVTRLVLDGGRQTLTQAVTQDRQALGYARVTDGKPCAFCAMLAARGPVYSVGAVGFRAHDHCGCTSEPVFSRDQAWPGRAREFQQQWSAATRGHSGRDALNAFRRSYGRR